ncbi:recombinase family protein [Clostridium botulinum]|nr:recombinase family protein [Clostridium botulinum]NFN49262.1 recombinase family protein [Clostridium botulinum]
MNFFSKLKLYRIFHERDTGNIQLSEMINYARSNDIIFIYSLQSMGRNIKSTVRFITQIYEKDIELIIKKEKINTSDRMGKYALNIISVLDTINGKNDLIGRDESSNNKGRLPRELSDLTDYIKQVEEKNMTVKEVCQRLNIGRTTYYRRCKALKDTKVKMEEA